MNAFNRLVMILIALLLIAVPVVVLLVAWGMLSADLVETYTNYRGWLYFFGQLSVSDFTQQVRIIAAVISALVAIIALVLLLRELSFGRGAAGKTIVNDTPGQEVAITAGAVRTLVEGAAREAGAVSPSVSLASEGRPYRVYCDIQVPSSGNFTEIATRTRENIQRVLDLCSVPYTEVEVTVQGTAS